ncbi:T-cell receptor-associated transmembrane adapter 1 [Tachyglossus aculeatus]|uniref:T-cell receptor-associated transmembrane adapter 1 n=1 Tax=Tachyglossus aculeatus TaxID=9261 RepID=UPI0018F327D8|nr:T-cell receptor-associated transmembrane adapter 1 [Tachyglossus aculeatus]
MPYPSDNTASLLVMVIVAAFAVIITLPDAALPTGSDSALDCREIASAAAERAERGGLKMRAQFGTTEFSPNPGGKREVGVLVQGNNNPFFVCPNYREEESYIEDTPIYGNLTQVSPEPVTESCYEQMRARPPRSRNEEQEPPVKAQPEVQMCYASLDHSFKGKSRKPRKPRKPKVRAADLDEDEQLSLNGPKTPLTTYHQSDSFQAGIAEESIHDDPVRLFGLIHAERELVNGQDGNPSR